jgi:hypothetical protein
MPLRFSGSLVRWVSPRARRAGRLAIGERVLDARMLTRISNFWALAARSVIGESLKTAEITECWPDEHAQKSVGAHTIGGWARC